MPPCWGILSHANGDDWDWYAINPNAVPAGQTFKAALTPPAGSNFDVCLYLYATQAPLSCATNTSPGAIDSISYVMPSSDAGKGHFLAVYAWDFANDGTGEAYQLRACSSPQTSGC